jgi:hypothetical protein
MISHNESALSVIIPASPGKAAGVARVEIYVEGKLVGNAHWFDYKSSESQFRVEVTPKVPFRIVDVQQHTPFYITVPNSYPKLRGVVVHFGYTAATTGNTSASRRIVQNRPGENTFAVVAPPLGELADTVGNNKIVAASCWSMSFLTMICRRFSLKWTQNHSGTNQSYCHGRGPRKWISRLVDVHDFSIHLQTSHRCPELRFSRWFVSRGGVPVQSGNKYAWA